MDITPLGYQGPAQHTATTACDGFHEPGRCKEAPIRIDWSVNHPIDYRDPWPDRGAAENSL